MIHIEGMGWLGSVTALFLDRWGVPFTWHDIDLPHVAWKASTGLVYPAGDARSTRDLAKWEQWRSEDIFPSSAVECVTYVYGHKNPPHGGAYAVTRLSSGISMAHAPCLAIDAPAIVHYARERFAEQRRSADTEVGTLIRAHGGRRIASWMWGWSVPVTLTLPDIFQGLDMRPAIYGRRVRRLAYAYPIPRTDRWWAGSTLVRQTNPRPLDVRKHVERWMVDFSTVFPDVQFQLSGNAAQGWRPRPNNGDVSALPQWDETVSRPTIEYPALWHSGIRWAPGVIEWMKREIRR